MDAQLEERWKSAESPFAGDCLFLSDYLPLSDLRLLMDTVVGVLRDNATAPLYRVEDWHEHDGFITQRSITSWEQIARIIATDDSLYAARHGDEYVRWAYYPNDFSFLFRFYVLDIDDEPDRPGVWGDCDLCASPAVIENVRQRVPSSISDTLGVENAKEHFDRSYGG